MRKNLGPRRAITGAIFSVLLLVTDGPRVIGHFPHRESAAEERKRRSDIDVEREFFERWFGTQNAVNIDMESLWEQVQNLPAEEDVESPSGGAVNAWQLIGPSGFPINYGMGTARYSGRILDIESPESGPGLRIAAASGGLWQFVLIFPVPLSDAISSLAVATLATKPGNPNHILIGTGERVVGRSGTGLWGTSDGGNTWINLLSDNDTADVRRVRFTPGNPNVVHAATERGYFRSDDGGDTWVKRFNGNLTDIAINPSNPNVLYTASWGDALYQSTNGGNNWTRLTTPGIPTTDVGRVALSLCNNSPNVVYASINQNSSRGLLGIYKTINGGASWTNVSPPGEGFGQGEYNNAIGVSPTNPNLVLAGFIKLYRTVNGGASWTKVDDLDPSNHDNVHDDLHAVTWHSNGTQVWVGTDGGFSVSFDSGITWSPAGNNLPISQFYHIGVGAYPSDGVIYGGTQDNGVVGTTNGGSTWLGTICCDGIGADVDPTNGSRVFSTFWPGGDSVLRMRSLDSGLNWTEISTGADSGNGIDGVIIRNDQVAPIYLYTNAGGPYVYKSTDLGSSWFRANPEAFPGTVWRISVSLYSSPSAVIYAMIATNPLDPNKKLRVYDRDTWYERSAGFPLDVDVREVAQHPTNNNVAYALMNRQSEGQRIYKTTNRGVTWTNITGDLPDLPLGGLVPHPTNDNVLFLGTAVGCFKTTNGGANWYRWNNGMPTANIVTDMRFIDRRSVDGRFYVVAGTYGRSIWKREVSGDDP